MLTERPLMRRGRWYERVMNSRVGYVPLLALLLLVATFAGQAHAANLLQISLKRSQQSNSTFPSENLGGIWYNQFSAHSAVSWGSNRVDQFVVGTNSQLYHYWLDSTPHLESWGGVWADNHGMNATRPAVVSWGSPRLDVFLVGQNGRLYHYWQAGGSVYHLEALPAADTSFAPNGYVTATTWGVGRLDVFLIGTNGNLYHYWQDNTAFFGWEDLGGNGGFNTSVGPTAVSWGPGRLDVFIVYFIPGQGGQMMHYWQSPGEWRFVAETIMTGHDWNWSTPPAAVSWGAGRLDVFAYASESSNYQLYHAWRDGFDDSPFGEEPLSLLMPGVYFVPAVTAVSWGVGRLDAFSTGPRTYMGSPLYHLWQQNSNPFGTEVIDSNVAEGSEVAATSWGVGRLDVFAGEGDPLVYETVPLYHFWQG